MIPDLKPIADFISQVGFPIFVAVVLLWQVFAMDRKNRAALEKQNQALGTIIDALNQILHKEGLK